MPDIVRVKNLGNTPHRSAYNGQPYEIPPGGERTLDREAAVKDFGDWTARNLGPRPRDRKRDKEVARVLGLYGVHKGARIPVRPMQLDEHGEPLEVLSDSVRDAYLPKVEIFEESQPGSFDIKVVTVIDDPEGKNLPLEGAAAGDVAAVVSSQKDQLTEAQRQIAELREMVMAGQGQQISAPKDEPTTAKRPAGKKPEVTASQATRD